MNVNTPTAAPMAFFVPSHNAVYDRVSALTGVSSAVKPSAWPPAKNCWPWRGIVSTA